MNSKENKSSPNVPEPFGSGPRVTMLNAAVSVKFCRLDSQLEIKQT